MRYVYAALVLALGTSGATAQHVRVLGDINPSSVTFLGFPEGPTLGEGGATLGYFVFADPMNFIEVWRTDGTPEGTRPLGDVTSFRPNFVGVTGDTAVFEANMILASSNGVPGQFSAPLARFSVPNRNSIDNWLPHAARDGRLYFADQMLGSSQVRLYATDGTSAGTTELYVSPQLGFRINSIAATPTHVFAAVEASPNFPRTLIASTGNPPGPATVVRTFPAGTVFSGLGLDALVSAGPRVVFTAPDNSLRKQVWVSDGTDAGTIQLSAFTTFFAAPTPGVWNGSRLAFLGPTSAGSGGPSTSLWTSDLTAAGTARATFPYPVRTGLPLTAPSTSSPRAPVVALNGVFAIVGDRAEASPRYGLYVGDGSGAGTSLIPTGSALVNEFIGVTPLGRTATQRAYFTASIGAVCTLWSTDGTPGGTSQLPLLPSSVSTSDFRPLAWVGRSLVVGVRETLNSWSIWSTDGSPGGTRQVAGARISAPLLGSSSAVNFTAFDNQVVFGADNTGVGYERYRTTGAAQSATLCEESVPGDDTNIAPAFVQIGPRLFSQASRLVDVKGVPTSRDALFVSTSASELGTLLYQSPGTEGIRYMAAFGDRLLFGAPLPEDPNQTTLWVSDGSLKGTAPVVGPGPGRPLSIVSAPFGWRGQAYFIALAPGAPHYALWQTDGTPDGTRPLAEFIGASTSAAPGFAPLNDTLYFTAYDSGTFTRLWCTDGSPKGTHVISPDVSLGSPTGAGAVLAPLGGRLYASAFRAGEEAELWVVALDNSTLDPILNVALGNPRCTWLTPVRTAGGDRLLFAVGTTALGNELWISDATPEGTGLLADIFPGPFSSSPSQLTRVGNRVVFAATRPDSGRELFETDGTPEGTRLYVDVAPGPDSSSPGALSLISGVAYFTAYHPEVGREPLSLPLVACTADFTDDGVVNSQDFFAFLVAFFALEPSADITRDGAVDSRDFFEFLTAFFSGCV